jgi:hypothetical protein
MIKQPDLQEIYVQFITMMDKIFPPAEKPTLKLQISQSQQLKQVEILKQTVPYGKFFFVVDVLEHGEISHAHGLKEWLGIDDWTFSFKNYLSIIHPGYLQTLYLLANSAHTIANDNKNVISFMANKYIIKLPLLSRKEGFEKEKYVTVVRTLSPWQLDQYNRTVAYINEFQLLGDYDEEKDTFSPIVMKDFYNRDNHLEKKLRTITSKAFSKPFTSKELNILRLYAYEKGINITEISKKLKYKETAILTWNRRIIVKAETIFNIEFKTALSVANFLRGQCVI